MKIIKPPHLVTGDTIGIVASSLPVLPSFMQNYQKGKQAIIDLGFKVKEGETIKKQRWWMAGAPQEVAHDINAMFADSSVKAIFAQTGGYSAISVLEHLDYQLIKKNPKPFIGMSDMTAYHLAIFAKTGMVGFHMDDITFGFGRSIKEGQESLLKLDQEFFIRFLTKTDPPEIVTPLSRWVEWKKGKATGHLIGGILERLSTLAGTAYFPSLDQFEGAILFWEEVGMDLTQIYQFLYQLKYLGIFERISGMLIGKIQYLKPLRDKEVFAPTTKEMVLDILKGYQFPIMADLDFGHFTINIPMPIGTKVAFDSSRLELNFLESAVI